MPEVGILRGEMRDLLIANLKELSAVDGSLSSVATGRQVKTVLITSCNPSEGKTVAAISMAYALVTIAHATALVIDGNLYAPKIHEHFDVSPLPGLADFFMSNADLSEVTRDTEYEGLTIMPCGTNVPNKSEIFESDLFKTKLDPVKKMFDYIIIDGQSVFGSSESLSSAKYFDGIILVVECEKTKWEVLQEAKEKVLNAGGKILGVVLNKRKYYIPEKLYGKI